MPDFLIGRGYRFRFACYTPECGTQKSLRAILTSQCTTSFEAHAGRQASMQLMMLMLMCLLRRS